MNTPQLLAHFDRLAEAPGAVTKLRAFILDLAVRGKLVDQNPEDEPASEFLRKLAAEKDRLIKTGDLRQQAPSPPIDDAELPFLVPTGWSWSRLGDLSELITSGSRDWAKFYSSDGAIFVRMGNLSRSSYQLRLDSIQRVSPPTDGEGSRTRLQEADILISITGEVGLLGLIPSNFGEAYINQHTCLVRPMEAMRHRFLPEVFRSPVAQNQFNQPQRGIKNSFRLTDVSQLLVPIPPIAEQHRIVAKVDELMALCDRLEAAQTERERRRDRLAAASLHRLNHPDSAGDPSAFRAHARFHLRHLPRLTTRPDQIPALRQTILSLAFQGELTKGVPGEFSGGTTDEVLAQAANDRRKFWNARYGTKRNEPLATAFDSASLPHIPAR